MKLFFGILLLFGCTLFLVGVFTFRKEKAQPQVVEVIPPEEWKEPQVLNPTPEIRQLLESETEGPAELPAWNGILVILDPGHGGLDPGCSYNDNSDALVVEDEHAYDVCCRAKVLLERLGYKVVFTIEDRITSYKIQREPKIPVDRNELLIANPKLSLKGNTSCMNARIKAGSNAVELFKPKQTLWISVHIDSQGSSLLQGVHIVTPYEGSFTKAMKTAFEEENYLRKKNGQVYHAVGINGDPRKLYVLRPDKNPLRSCILIELGNITNDTDRAIMLTASGRETWAKTLVKGICNTPPPPPPKTLSQSL